MLVKERLKDIDWLRRIVKKWKTWREYINDAKLFNKHYMEECDRKGNYIYRMYMLIHNLEKGMCMPNPRPFGKEKVCSLMKYIDYYDQAGSDKSASVYGMSISILNEWVCFYNEHNWQTDATYQQVVDFLKNYPEENKCSDVGYEIITKKNVSLNGDFSFDNVAKTRKSIRNYEDKPLDETDVVECIKIAQMAPTACNRQMISIVQVNNRESCDLITNTIYGAAGITTDTVTYFVLTFDINAFDYYGERNQGYLNAGLVAMNFVNALHTRGIGTCFLQWANNVQEDKLVRNRLGISEHERVAVVIAAGYYSDEMYVAKSMRRNYEEIYRKI